MDPKQKRHEFSRLRRELDRLQALRVAREARIARDKDAALPRDELRRAVDNHRKAAGRTAQQTILYRRDLPSSRAATPAPPPSPGEFVALEDAVAGSETRVEGSDKAYVVTTPVREVVDAAHVCGAFAKVLRNPASPLGERLSPICDPSGLAVEDVIFMDIECTGLSSSPLFLIGVMVWSGSGLEVRQFLARNYAEERAVLRLFVNACAGKRLLVTFNGKSFDVPYIRARAVVAGIRYEPTALHFDLLHESRRIWKDDLPNCKLQTLERCICDRQRIGDIPGSEIPEAYHEYVRTGHAAKIVNILHHNMLDLVTLAELMTRLPPR